MRVKVEWMDKTVRTYDWVEKAAVGSDRVLRLYRRGSRAAATDLIMELPIDNIRQIERDENAR